jgi:chemotaxis protein MotA
MNIFLIFSNMLTYDILIVLLAVFNGYILVKLTKESEKLYKLINPTVYIPIEHLLHSQDKHNGSFNLHHMREIKEKETKYANLFLSISGLFPLLGILGTIISLIKIVTFSNSEVIVNFSSALTSTFWGLVFAIIFKAIYGIISSKVETNAELMSLLINRIDDYNLKLKLK